MSADLGTDIPMLNLWELMIREQTQHPVPGVRKKIAKAITDLSAHGRSGQELSIGTTERGWLLKIHSCDSDAEVLILIPQDHTAPVEIVKDTRHDPYSDHEYCVVCRECVTCNLRPCRDGGAHRTS